MPVIGYQEVIQSLSRDDVYEYYKLTYQPNNMVFSVCGDMEPEEWGAAVRLAREREEASSISTADWLIGIPNPLLWGFVTFLAHYIPQIGGGASTPGRSSRRPWSPSSCFFRSLCLAARLTISSGGTPPRRPCRGSS